MARKNPTRWTTESFIEKAKEVHGDKYDYSETIYTATAENVKIICKEHGLFDQRAQSHLKGSGCRACSSNEKKLGTKRFIEIARSVHGDRYSYERSEYSNRVSGIIITCPVHGDFKQRAGHHMDGFGCAKCAGLAKKDTAQFIEEAIAAHGDRYDYNLVNYKTAKNKVRIICKKHGEFLQMPSEHLSGKGCRKCADNDNSVRLTKSNEQWIAEARAVHGDKYIYDQSVYNGAFGKVEVVCPKHGPFWTVGVYHVASKRGCPRCKDSWLEASVAETLEKIGVEYKAQATFAALVHKRRLKFDFYIPSIGLFIEANGIQHREPIPFYGGDEGLRSLRARDKLKADFVANIPEHKLLIVWSGEDIERIVTDEVNKRLKAKSRKKKPETMPLLLSA